MVQVIPMILKNHVIIVVFLGPILYLTFPFPLAVLHSTIIKTAKNTSSKKKKVQASGHNTRTRPWLHLVFVPFQTCPPTKHQFFAAVLWLFFPPLFSIDWFFAASCLRLPIFCVCLIITVWTFAAPAAPPGKKKKVDWHISKVYVPLDQTVKG